MSGNEKFSDILKATPYLEDFFQAFGLPRPGTVHTVDKYFELLSQDMIDNLGMTREDLKRDFFEFKAQLGSLSHHNINSLEIIGGHNKKGEPENISILLSPGDILSVVGPTGAGKSRLLEDIECLAQGDTPTGRKILVNGIAPSEEDRFNVDNHMVAQLSQNMNFVVDLCIADFLLMHAESRMVSNPHQVVQKIFATANELAGEKFTLETSVTALSGGQSRALMIADTACLSQSPIVLIDEIENAGVDRNKALELLIKQEKIVILVTHDPELALLAPRRLVIRDGGMKTLLDRTDAELATLKVLAEYSGKIAALRNSMRNGETMLEKS